MFSTWEVWKYANGFNGVMRICCYSLCIKQLNQTRSRPYTPELPVYE